MAHAAQTKAEAARKPPDEVSPPPQPPKPESSHPKPFENRELTACGETHVSAETGEAPG